MRIYEKKCTAGQGKSLRYLLEFLSQLKVKHCTMNLSMYKVLGEPEKQYTLKMVVWEKNEQ